MCILLMMMMVFVYLITFVCFPTFHFAACLLSVRLASFILLFVSALFTQ